jgi:site-specific recombinase XerD
MKTIASFLDREKLLRRFREHLLSTQGLAPRTCTARLFYVREFFQRQLKSRRRKIKLQELTPEVLLNYILERSAQDSSGRLQALASALRSFGRFLQLSGRSRHDWASALPRIASPGRSALPDYLQPEQLSALLRSIDPTTASGRRNSAILLCLARLGLRAAEVAALTLDQIHWRKGAMDLGAGKGRRERQLPLAQEVGRAIATYLLERKVQTDSRRVFCAIRNGKSLSSMAITQVANRALKRAGIQTPRPGAHLLRRTLASHLIQHGVSLKAVADLLGHRCLDTTRLYANVNHSMLVEVSRPWPTEVRR